MLAPPCVSAHWCAQPVLENTARSSAGAGGSFPFFATAMCFAVWAGVTWPFRCNALPGTKLPEHELRSWFESKMQRKRVGNTERTASGH